MSAIRFAWRAWWVVLWLFAGLLTLGLVYPLIGLEVRLSVKRFWSRGLLWICGIELRVGGQKPEQGPVLWVVNHVSWLDIFVLNHERSATFVAKQEIRHWPLIGWLAAGADTIFIERGYRHAVQRVGQAMQARFERGQAVGLFPEGTTSTGFDVLPFYANLFEPAKRAAVPIQPVALIYYHHGKRSDYAAFVGEETLIQNVWRVLGTTGLSIEIVFLNTIPVESFETLKRNELSSLARQDIQRALFQSASKEPDPG